MKTKPMPKYALGGPAFAVLTTPASAGALKSKPGDDYSYDSNNYQTIFTCGSQSDGHRVHADYTVRRTDGVGEGQELQVTDVDGNNGVCASVGVGQEYLAVQRHRTVEERNFAPDYEGNWQDTGAPG